jgi:hypothetical protein
MTQNVNESLGKEFSEQIMVQLLELESKWIRK